MNVNEHDINTMNGWRSGKTKTLMQGSIMRIHNCPKFSVMPNLLEWMGEEGGGLFSPQNSTAGHVQNMNSAANQLRKQRISLKGSASTQQHQRRDPRGLTNPHILQQQHPHGALEPLCILVNHTPYHHTSVTLEATAATAALLT